MLLATALAYLAMTSLAEAKNVYIAHDPSLVQADYASRKLGDILKAQGAYHRDDGWRYDCLISIAVNGHGLAAEAFTIKPEGRHITVYGGDARGMVYGALAEDVRSRGVAGASAG